MACEELRLALDAVASVTELGGQVDVETVLYRVFKDFCIGK